MSKKVYAPDGRRLIFRVQNSFGEGPYQASVETETGRYVDVARLLLKHMYNSPGRNMRHPNPLNDAGLCDFWERPGGHRAAYLFGFRDLEQLTNWFMWPRRMYWCRGLAEIGVYAIDQEYIDGVVDGQFQSIFHKDAAEQVAALPLNTTYYNPETGETHAD